MQKYLKIIPKFEKFFKYFGYELTRWHTFGAIFGAAVGDRSGVFLGDT